MIPFRPNPKTGFLESNPYTGFDSNLKTRFLELAQECVERKEMPDIPAMCKAVGIGTKCFYVHRAEDEVFREAWESILDQCEMVLVKTMYANGQRPSGYMDRITWLRAHRPGTWNPDFKLTIRTDETQTKGLLDGASKVFEAEIVPNLENNTATKPQPDEKP